MQDPWPEAFESWLAGHLRPEALAAHRQKTGRPLVTLTYAQSLDGSLTARPGQPTALSGEQAMRLTHYLRSAHDAILVGIGALLADDSRLTARLDTGGAASAQPRPVLLDSRLRLSLDARVFEHPKSPWIATLEGCPAERGRALQQRGARLLALPPGEDGRLSLPALLQRLADLGIASLMVEGGAEVLASFFCARLFDLAVVTVVPAYAGGLHLPMEPGRLLRLRDSGGARLGQDWVIWGQAWGDD